MAAAPRFVCAAFWSGAAGGDVVFVGDDPGLDAFVDTVLPFVDDDIVLVTLAAPSDRARDALHVNPRVRRWYAADSPWTDHKTVPIPVGVRPCDHAVVAAAMAAQRAAGPKLAKVLVPRGAGEAAGHPAAVVAADVQDFARHLAEVGRHRYAVCDTGQAACEAILLRTVPVLVGSHVPAIFRDLPAVVAQSPRQLLQLLDVVAAGLDTGTGPGAGLGVGLDVDAIDWDAAHRFLTVDDVQRVYGLRCRQ